MLKQINYKNLEVSELNIRTMTKGDGKELAELSGSINEKGVIEPLIVRKKNGDNFEIIVGQRRFLAGRKVGIKDFPCLVEKLTDAESVEHSLVENLQRQDVDPIDLAEGFKKWIDLNPRGTFNAVTSELSQKIGLSKRQIEHYLSLVNLVPETKELISEGKITIESGAKLKDIPEKEQKEFAKEFSKTLEEKPITQVEEKEIIERVRKEPGKIKQTLKDVTAGMLPEFVQVSIITGDDKLKFNMKKKYFEDFSKEAEKRKISPMKLLEDIIKNSLKKWGYKID